MEQLLTPEQVAFLLQISIRSVYRNARVLGGFYPAGIRVLRFRVEVICNAGMAGEGARLAVSVPISGSVSV